MEQGPSREAK